MLGKKLLTTLHNHNRGGVEGEPLLIFLCVVGHGCLGGYKEHCFIVQTAFGIYPYNLHGVIYVVEGFLVKRRTVLICYVALISLPDGHHAVNCFVLVVFCLCALNCFFLRHNDGVANIVGILFNNALYSVGT